MQHILQNSLRTPDGTEIISRHRHHFVKHHDSVTDRDYCVDGGLDYLRRSFQGDEEDTSQYYDPDNHHHNRIWAVWGTYGKDGDQPLKYKAVADMETDHIEAVLANCSPRPILEQVMRDELEYRRINDDSTTDCA